MSRVAVGLAALTLTVGLAGCGASDTAAPAQTGTPSDTPTGVPPHSTPTVATTGPQVVTDIATDLQTPWGLAFLPDGDALVTERDTTRVLRIDAGSHAVTVLGRMDDAYPDGEGGLLGVAVSPDFATDHTAYFYFSTTSDNRVVKATIDATSMGTPQVVLDGIPHGSTHDGGRLAFGPDGYLYVSTGETREGDLAQDKGSLGGKILRITTSGAPAPGNPFGTPVFSYGHRNVQGLAFDDAGHLWASEFGEDTFDELNLIEPGHNYGWPMVEGKQTGTPDPALTDPQQTWATDDASPSGLAYLDGHLWMAALKGERLWRVTVDGASTSDPTPFFVGTYGRMRTVAVAPDGTLWVTTSNRDGRGEPHTGDDRIIAVQP